MLSKLREQMFCSKWNNLFPKGVSSLKLGRTYPPSLPGHAAPIMEAPLKPNRQSPGSVATSSIHGRRPASSERCTWKNKSPAWEARIGLEIPLGMKSQQLRAERTGKNRKMPSYIHIFHWSPFHLRLIFRGFDMRTYLLQSYRAFDSGRKRRGKWDEGSKASDKGERLLRKTLSDSGGWWSPEFPWGFLWTLQPRDQGVCDNRESWVHNSQLCYPLCWKTWTSHFTLKLGFLFY